LAEFNDPDYFFVDEEKAAVVFRANAGAASTIHSSYPRSELREMETGNAGEEAAWGTDDGIIHRMEITQAITHLPEVKPHVVAGQIHDAGDDLTMFRLEGTKLFVDLNGNDGPVLTEDYALGEKFTVAFIAGNGVVTYEYNGEPVRDENGDVFELEAGDVKGCYFKAGCYTQSNLEKGDEPEAYGEVIIYDLFVIHGDEIHTKRRGETAIGEPLPFGAVGLYKDLFMAELSNSLINLRYNLFERQEVVIKIFDGKGRLFRFKPLGVKTAGCHIETIPANSLPNGQYHILLSAGHRNRSVRFIATNPLR